MIILFIFIGIVGASEFCILKISNKSQVTCPVCEPVILLHMKALFASHHDSVFLLFKLKLRALAKPMKKQFSMVFAFHSLSGKRFSRRFVFCAVTFVMHERTDERGPLIDMPARNIKIVVALCFGPCTHPKILIESSLLHLCRRVFNFIEIVSNGISFCITCRSGSMVIYFGWFGDGRALCTLHNAHLSRLVFVQC